ncbi:MAG: protein phosphatase 2C domain-containing protein [Terracidiphilus sp.]
MSDVQVHGKASILIAEECDRGKVRKENQDTVLHASIALGELLIVADGIGGYTGGATASRLAVDAFYEHLSALPRDYAPENAMIEAAGHANANINAAAKEPGTPNARMGTTVVVALVQQDIDGTHAWVGHIGDSRAYLFRAGRLHRLTIDHSAVQSLLDRNLITPEEARHHPDASVLSRSLGHHATVEIDIEQHPLAVGDTLLLCSDGLWGFVAETEIQKTAADLALPLEIAAHNLLGLALAAGGRDNIGIEMARIVTPPVAAQPRNQFPLALKVVWAMFLLGLIGLGILTYLTFFYNR